MKSTFFFLAMLIFVQCSTDTIAPIGDVDPTLLEISRDPSSEAVFATMAIQLETTGGFHKVLGLLNELVHDSKEQLHSMTKIWRGVNARCHISKIKLHGRQEFFETYLSQAQRHVRQSTQRLAEVQDHLVGFRKSQVVYKALLKSEIARHNVVRNGLKARHADAKNGLASLKSASAAVNDWSPKDRALVQTHLKDVATAYLQVKNYELPDVTELLERTTDTKVKARLAEWLAKVASHLEMGAAQYAQALERLEKIGGQVEQAIARMVIALKAGVLHLNKAVTYTQHMIKAGNNGVVFFSKLVRQNTKLIAANKQYCDNESLGFHKNAALAKSAIKLFREVRNYFTNHYKNIHSFIKAKYNKTD